MQTTRLHHRRKAFDIPCANIHNSTLEYGTFSTCTSKQAGAAAQVFNFVLTVEARQPRRQLLIFKSITAGNKVPHTCVEHSASFIHNCNALQKQNRCGCSNVSRCPQRGSKATTQTIINLQEHHCRHQGYTYVRGAVNILYSPL